jgi:hypothetical protein
MSNTLEEIIDRLWIAPLNAEWTPKTDTVSLSDVREWFKNDDIEVLGFTNLSSMTLVFASSHR